MARCVIIHVNSGGEFESRTWWGGKCSRKCHLTS